MKLAGALDRDDADRSAPAPGAELNRTGHKGEQRVVTAAPDAGTRVEVGASLPDDDLARLDDLTAEPLDAEPLRVGVTSIPAGRGALLVCHVCVPLRARTGRRSWASIRERQPLTPSWLTPPSGPSPSRCRCR